MMKKIMLAAVAASSLLSVPTFAQTANTGAGQPNENANCVGTERASRNSNGGDRAQGTFGQEQAAYVAWINSGATEYMNFGEFLRTWKAACN